MTEKHLFIQNYNINRLKVLPIRKLLTRPRNFEIPIFESDLVQFSRNRVTFTRKTSISATIGYFSDYCIVCFLGRQVTDDWLLFKIHDFRKTHVRVNFSRHPINAICMVHFMCLSSFHCAYKFPSQSWSIGQYGLFP